jgi:transcriptional regulator with XRE-family HTH domain
MSMQIGRVLRIIRQAKCIKLSELADLASLSVPFLSLVENGERQPSLGVLRRLSCALGVPVEALIVLSQPSDGSLSTSNGEAKSLALSIQRLVKAEDALRTRLGSRAKTDDEAEQVDT